MFSAGLKPYVEIGFMPKALLIRPDLYPTKIEANQRVPIDAGQAYPPKNYDQWRNLVYEWVRHCVRRYGAAEVGSWRWEVWNEPNISYWQGTRDEYFKLYDYAVDGVRRALPRALVGGPEQAGGGGKFLRAFLEHCLSGRNDATGGRGAPIDFISFHAKGKPRFVENHVRMGLAHELNDVESGFATVASFDQFKNTPVMIGESDPDGCAACTGPELGYRNTPQYACYTAAAIDRECEIAAKHHVNFQGALTWAFEFENEPLFAGHRVLSTNGIDLPVLNVFRMFSKLRGERLEAQSSSSPSLDKVETLGVRGPVDVSSIATLDLRQLAIMLWDYRDDDVPGPAADVELSIANLPHDGGAMIARYRIDQTHCNPMSLWRQMGSPPHPTAEQYSRLKAAGRLAADGPPQSVQITARGIDGSRADSAARGGSVGFDVRLIRKAECIGVPFCTRIS